MTKPITRALTTCMATMASVNKPTTDSSAAKSLSTYTIKNPCGIIAMIKNAEATRNRLKSRSARSTLRRSLRKGKIGRRATVGLGSVSIMYPCTTTDETCSMNASTNARA